MRYSCPTKEIIRMFSLRSFATLERSEIQTPKTYICRESISALHFNVSSETKKSTKLQKKLSALVVFNWWLDFYTIPENPINAIASNPATTRAIGVPFIPLGMLSKSICSRKPAKMINATPKPIAEEIA